ncbi:hypothetical protein E2C01_060200 [Portunus trituberculatus]|uniref:Uncharacterized protein n=1 Tax=Portunus trituberculatus TaxID=210409 RepID=A0A5B7H9T9_PORTR|nr:hypothetical protein [Portunus trituberculatus]
MTLVTILDGCPTQIVDALRLPDHDKDRQTVPNLAIHLKFRGSFPERVAIGNMVYHVRAHTLPVMHCTSCLLFGHSNISCNGRARYRKCSGYHDTDRTPTSVPTLAPRPTSIEASIPAPIPDPTPAPTKPLSPIISVVPLTAQPPSPKAQRSHHHHKPHHTVTPRRTTRPSFISEGPYSSDLTDVGEFVPSTPLHQCHPPKVPKPKAPQPAAQQPLPSLGSAGFVPSSSSLPA